MGGTLAYMPPEAMRRRGRIGFGVDIYSLGFLAFQAILSLQGFKKLYGATKPKDWIRWVLSSEPFQTLRNLNAPVSEGFSRIVAKMLEKDVTMRYQKVGRVIADLEELIAERGDSVSAANGSSDEGTPMPSDGPSSRFFGAVRRARGLLGGAGTSGSDADTESGPETLPEDQPSASGD
jgi:serine/threonine protein kinase